MKGQPFRIPVSQVTQGVRPSFVGTGRFDRWEVTDVRGSDVGGWYYSLNVVGSAGEHSSVSVKLSKHGKHFCGSCVKSDDCLHASFVALVIDAEGLPIPEA